MHKSIVLAALALALSCAFLQADKPGPDKPYTPNVAAASDEPLTAVKKIRVPPGLQINLWAAEPLLANPVCFCFDGKGRCYVAETWRLHAGVTDIRGHMNWLDDDLACRTVADRVAMYRKFEGKKFDSYEVHHDRVRLLEDTTGTGKADKATTFADGFHHADEGIGAGLLAWRGKVWYTCIPALWQLQDTKGTGTADVRKPLQTGYGVHNGFIGHDLHGLRMGPDGKLYFSIGDRGLNVQTDGRTVASPDCGAVLRCNPDGSELELVHTGLRNPQELAFDQYGNLFTGDNNADGGDAARWVYIVEGGDSGWRIGYQFMHIPGTLGPWNAEKLWHPAWDGQAAYLVPPIAHVASGPSGLTYYPGVGLPERYQNHFFLADFRGSSGGSGIRSFAVKPKGAGFEFTDQHEFIWSVLATDVEFGPDCALYVSDWTEGWGLPRKGRIWRIRDPKLDNDPTVQNVKKLLADGMAQRSRAELAKLLEHADLRVRQEAQFALADKGADASATLTDVARDGKHQLARLHALWGLGQIGRQEPAALKSLLPLLKDADIEVRAQAARVIGDAKLASATDALLTLLKDPEARVRFFAAQALGKIGNAHAAPALIAMLRANADQDRYLRHAGVMALARLHPQDVLHAAAKDESPAVRMAVLLALRRLESPDVVAFLKDSDPRLVLEAARAINDVPIAAGLPALAALIHQQTLSEPLGYRVLNARFRLAKKENAEALAAFAARSDVPEALRLEALRELGEWDKPSGRDRIVGLWRPLEPRSSDVAAAALRPALGGIFSGPDKVRQEAAKLAGKYGIKEIGPTLLALLGDKERPAQVRVEALQALTSLQDERLKPAMKLALADNEALLRVAGRRVQAKLDPAAALAGLTADLESNQRLERQGAFAILAEMAGPEEDQLLSRWLDKLLEGEVAPEVRLDLLEAAAKRPTESLKQKLAKFEAARNKNDHLANYREALQGGDAEAGKRVFWYKAEVSCLRCHKIKGEGGDVGPDLFGIGAKQSREYLLESIVDPSKQIAKGYETVVLGLKDGRIETGVVKSEDAREIAIMTAEGKRVVVPKDQIEDRASGKSAMPEDVVKKLSKRELRDLVEFLATLK
jgi:quinoprotein glucose dehydrogenase